jgi:methylated-DNA-[protein]-cysteine S-methyltransferase
LRRNPFAPEVPCHRIICADGVSNPLKRVEAFSGLIHLQSIGGFKGERQDAPSGINQIEKLRLLKSEGVLFDENRNLIDQGRWWYDFKVE